MNRKRNLTAVLVILFILIGCAGKGVVNTTQPTSVEGIAFKTITLAFGAYDLGMTTLRTLERNKVITSAKYKSIKDSVAWPFYKALMAAETAAQEYATSPAVSKTTVEGKLNQALLSLNTFQSIFIETIQDIGGK